MALLETKTSSMFTNNAPPATTSVFNKGKFTVTAINVKTSKSSSTSPPKPLLIVTPTIEGSYPIVLFLHGFCLRNNFYTDLLHHISSHGFIVVAPQVLYILYYKK